PSAHGLDSTTPSTSSLAAPRFNSSPGRNGGARASLYYAGQPGEGSGGGVCNRNLLMELSRLTSVVPLAFSEPAFRDTQLPGDLFTPLEGVKLAPFSPARGTRNFGYAFFENELTEESVENAARFETIFVGSNWCQQRLLEKGVSNGAVLI